MMRDPIHILLFVFILNACGSNKHGLDSFESENLKIEKIGNNLFKHISYLYTEDQRKIPCNGMIYLNNNEAIIFDTPTNNTASAELLDWIGSKKVKAIIATHFHADCLGGLNEFHSKGINSYGSNLTIDLAKENSATLPKNGFDKKLEIKVGNETIALKHFGQGHTKDNIIGYINSEKALFGGCLIKGLGAEKGNLADANIKEWPITVSKIKKAFPELEIVVPGHGKSGGKELLDYTIDLFTEK